MVFEIKALDLDKTDVTEVGGIAVCDWVEEKLKTIVPEEYYTKYGEDVVPAVIFAAVLYLWKPKKGELFGDVVRGIFKASAGRAIGTRILK
jgi:hypothetical protein